MNQDIEKFIKGFGYAFQGIKTGSKERNFRIHVLAALLVVSASVYFDITAFEWMIVLILIGVVISAELMNSAIEEVCNLLNRKLNLEFGDTTNPRNLAAGAVLVVAIVAAIIAILIFLPYLLTMFL